MKRFFILSTILISGLLFSGWGFFAHKKINRLAVFTLPPEMIGFYKRNINYITEKAINPDMRRYIMQNEAPRHYIDLDEYGDSAIYKLPRYWRGAVDLLTEDTLNAYGIVPWHINLVKYQLTQAFLNEDMDRVLRYSADLGHYIADANVPLHTTSNYNGQETNQVGIHGFWESRLPELFYSRYDLLTGRAEYVKDTQMSAWNAVIKANSALDSVLNFERRLTKKFSESKKYSFEERGASTIRVYSYEFSEQYHAMLNGMVERQMKRAVKMLGDFWYTAWVDGGQPDLDRWDGIRDLQDTVIYESEIMIRNHESGVSTQ
ncbi:MAG: zinc dependent phospholipase C family protein [Cyclobacteriaceae bacterium]